MAPLHGDTRVGLGDGSDNGDLSFPINATSQYRAAKRDRIAHQIHQTPLQRRHRSSRSACSSKSLSASIAISGVPFLPVSRSHLLINSRKGLPGIKRQWRRGYGLRLRELASNVPTRLAARGRTVCSTGVALLAVPPSANSPPQLSRVAILSCH